MRRTALVLLSVILLFVALLGQPESGSAEVDVRVGISVPLPELVIPAPPPVVVIPRTYVYYVPNVPVDIFFYRGYWYRPHQGLWFRARDYNGPWLHVTPGKVPYAISRVPPYYRHGPPGHQHIPYGQLEKNWRTWEREKHWDRHDRKEWSKEEKWERNVARGEQVEGRHRGRGRED